MQTFNKENFLKAISTISAIMDENRDKLIEIDGEIGDGDLGITMKKGFKAAKKEAEESTDTEMDVLFKKTGFAISKAAPSTMGTLLATAFMGAGKAFEKGKTELELDDLNAMFRAMADSVSARGKAKVGDKTLLDVLYPVADAVESEKIDSTEQLFDAAVKAAEKGLEETKNLMSQHGKAAVFRDKTMGKQDPGATAAYLMIQGFSKSVS